jgi:glycosyltransferase involved in cell wall biosynthesis
MKKFNLLFMSMSGEMLGGGQKSLLLLLERLDRKKYNPFLICPTYGNFIKRVEKLRIETSLLKTGSLKNPNIFSFIATIRKLIRFIKQNNIHLIHTDAPRQTFYAGIAARLTKIPLVWHVRISEPETKRYDKTLIFLSHKVIAVSKAVEKRLEKAASQSKKTVVIYNGINLAEYGQQHPMEKLKKELGIDRDNIVIGTASQLIPSKGHRVLLEAAAQTLDVFPKLSCIIIGDGNKTYRQELFDLSQKLGIEKKVIFTGFREDIPPLINLMDIVVLPSTHPEGLSRLLLEAMASSKPVIASAVGGNLESVEDGRTGLIVNPEDVDSLFRAILELVRNEKLRHQMGTAGRRRAEKLFSIDQNVAQIEHVYEELLCQNM